MLCKVASSGQLIRSASKDLTSAMLAEGSLKSQLIATSAISKLDKANIRAFTAKHSNQTIKADAPQTSSAASSSAQQNNRYAPPEEASSPSLSLYQHLLNKSDKSKNGAKT